MLFMKGSKSEPFCKFSRATIKIMKETGVNFGTFDIFSDESVRQGLKVYSDWPTYPQLYVKGEFVGGYDIMREMHENGSLVDIFPSESLPHIESHEGTPSSPNCGFSKQIVQLLDMAGVKYSSYDVLEDEELREELKKISDWPTYPQLYANGKLIGGIDIVKEIIENGGPQGLKEELQITT